MKTRHLPTVLSSLPPDEARRAGRASALGIEMSATIIGFLLLGWWADGFFELRPWLTIGGVLMGSFGGFMVVWRFIRTRQKEDKQ